MTRHRPVLILLAASVLCLFVLLLVPYPTYSAHPRTQVEETPLPAHTPMPTLCPGPNCQYRATVAVREDDAGEIGVAIPACIEDYQWSEVYFGWCSLSCADPLTSGFHFGNVRIAPGPVTSIESAKLRLMSEGTYPIAGKTPIPIDVLLWADNTSNSNGFGWLNLPSYRPTSPVSSEWSIPADEQWLPGEKYDTADIGPLIAYVLGLADWRPGNGLTILANSPPYALPTDADTSKHRRVMAKEHVGGAVTPVPAELVVDYSVEARITCEQGGLREACADGFDSVGGGPQAPFRGARAYIESARPTIRQEEGREAFRVALTNARIENSSGNAGFVEIGWGYYPDAWGERRAVYASWQCADPNVDCLDSVLLGFLSDDDYGVHDYLVTWHYYPVGPEGVEGWAFSFDGEILWPVDPFYAPKLVDFGSGMSVACGGETTRPGPTDRENDLGPAACFDLRYTRSIDGDFYPIWSPSFRVDDFEPYFYDATVIDRNSWQSQGPTR